MSTRSAPRKTKAAASVARLLKQAGIKTGRPRRHIEDEIQRAVFQHLAVRPAKRFVAFHCPNGGWRSKREASRFKSLGVLPGVADVIIFDNVGVACLELKAPGNRPTDEQLAFGSHVQALGGRWAWADGLFKALVILEEWGMLKPAVQHPLTGFSVEPKRLTVKVKVNSHQFDPEPLPPEVEDELKGIQSRAREVSLVTLPDDQRERVAKRLRRRA